MFKKIILGASSIILAFSLSACGTSAENQVKDSQQKIGYTEKESELPETQTNKNNYVKNNNKISAEEHKVLVKSMQNGLNFLEIYSDIVHESSWNHPRIQSQADIAATHAFETIAILQSEYNRSSGNKRKALKNVIAVHEFLYDFHKQVAQSQFEDQEAYKHQLNKTTNLMNKYYKKYFNVIKMAQD